MSDTSSSYHFPEQSLLNLRDPTSLGETFSVRFIPSGVISKAQAMTSEMGNPAAITVTKTFHPTRRFKSREEDRARLDQEPRDYRVGDRDLVNIAPLQLGKERAPVAYGFVTAVGGTGTFNFWQSAAKRGSSL
jgi:hypothetical protein